MLSIGEYPFKSFSEDCEPVNNQFFLPRAAPTESVLLKRGIFNYLLSVFKMFKIPFKELSTKIGRGLSRIISVYDYSLTR